MAAVPERVKVIWPPINEAVTVTMTPIEEPEESFEAPVEFVAASIELRLIIPRFSRGGRRQLMDIVGFTYVHRHRRRVQRKRQLRTRRDRYR